MRGRQIAPRLWTPRASRRWAQRSQAAALVAPAARIDDFTSPNRLVSPWTFSRASKGWESSLDGVLIERAVDVARFQNDMAAPYAQRGLFVEGGVVNGVRNNTMAGAVAGTPGTLPTNWTISLAGLSQEVVGVVTRKGRENIRLRFFGTASGTLMSINTETSTGGPAAASGQTWCSSSGIALVASVATAPGAIRLVNQGMTGAGAGAETLQSGALAVTATPTRFSWVSTFSVGTIATARLGYRISLTNGASYDFTIDLELPQLEQAVYPTSEIKTTNAAVTRDTDKAVRSLTLDPAVGYTVLAEWRLFGEDQSASDRHALTWDDGTVANAFELTARLNSSKNIKFRAVLATVAVVDLNLGASAVAGTLERVAFAVKNGTVQVSYNGGAIASATPATVPTPTTMRAGHRVGGEGGLNGALARLVRISQFVGGDPLRALAAGGAL